MIRRRPTLRGRHDQGNEQDRRNLRHLLRLRPGSVSGGLFDTIQESAKDNAEACIETALTAGQGIQAANEQFLAYSKDAAAKSLETTKAIFASKSINEAIAIQTSFAKSAFEAYVGQIKKTRELYGRTAKDSVAPLKTRSEVFMSLIAEYARAV